MSDPIRTKPKSSMQIDNAPTPHNTPASVLNPSYLKNGNPVRAQAQEQDDKQVEMFELENKFLQKYKPIWEQRSRIISGQEQPKPEQIAKGQEIVESLNETELLVDEEEKAQNDSEEEQVKGIPSFWLTALENLPIVCDTITDRDAEVLEYLQDIGLEYLTDGRPGFKLLFRFDSSANPFFTNDILCKTYFYQKELGYSGDFIYDHAEGCEISWKDNAHNVTVDLEMRKQRNKTTKQVRTIEKITPIESFFNFFDPPKIQNEDQDEELEEDLEERLALDYSIGEQLKDKLIPRAVDWFTGAALEFETVA
ncbi:HLJ1_G0005250.mRNA.1.CDS.1 [Saccharomyces cerevisiae]|nr:HLJ1_G0005250.mRNA.1.CDS.1 [Saccharomyces cerevisiae]